MIHIKIPWYNNFCTEIKSHQLKSLSPTISDLVFNSANFTAGFLIGVLATTTTFPWHDVWFLDYLISRVSKVILTACFSDAQTSNVILCTASVDTLIGFIKRNCARYDRENDMFLLYSQLINPFDILLWTLIFAHDLYINLHFWKARAQPYTLIPFKTRRRYTVF